VRPAPLGAIAGSRSIPPGRRSHRLTAALRYPSATPTTDAVRSPVVSPRA